jgi:hypothetical protein
MIAILGLEERRSGRLGNLRAQNDTALRVKKAMGQHVVAHYKPWVARITGISYTGSLCREFVQGTRDYRDSTSSGYSGVKLFFVLHPGYYEVREIVSLSKERRYFVKSEAGAAIEVDREEVVQWANEQNRNVCNPNSK